MMKKGHQCLVWEDDSVLRVCVKAQFRSIHVKDKMGSTSKGWV